MEEKGRLSSLYNIPFSIFLKKIRCYFPNHPQSAFACSELTIETLEQGVRYVQR